MPAQRVATPSELALAIASMIQPHRSLAADLPAWLAQSDAPEIASALVGALVANKIPVLSLDQDAGPWQAFYASDAFQAALSAERESWAAQRSEYGLARQALERAGVRDVMIKSVGLAPSLSYRSDNLDVMVPIESAPRARQALLSSGYIELRNVEEPHKYLFRKFHRGASVSAIHLHEFVGWGTGFMRDAQLLARARPAPDDELVAIPSAEDSLLIILAHAFYEDKEVKLGDLWKVMHLLRAPDGELASLDWALIDGQAEERGWRAGLDTCIWLWSALEASLYGQHSFPPAIAEAAQRQVPAWCQAYLQERLADVAPGAPPAFPLGVSFRFSKRHYYDKVLRDETLSWGGKARDMLLHSWAGVERRLPFKLQRSLLVSLSGVDGSGKTTLAEALRGALCTCDIQSRVVWSRGASSPATDRAIGLAKKLLADPSSGDKAESPAADARQAAVSRKRAWLRRPLIRAGWVCLTLADLVVRYWARIAWPLLRGQVVIADRYLYDALVELATLAERPALMQAWPARLARALVPRPHLAYWLDVAPEGALARKPEESLEHLQGQRQLFWQVADAWRLLVLETGQGPDLPSEADTIDQFTLQVLGLYYSRWRRPLGTTVRD